MSRLTRNRFPIRSSENVTECRINSSHLLHFLHPHRPTKALVKGLSKELGIDESFLNRLADEVRKDLS